MRFHLTASFDAALGRRRHAFPSTPHVAVFDTAFHSTLEPAAYERTVKVLLAGGSDPVIKKDPGKAAYSHAIYEAAQK